MRERHTEFPPSATERAPHTTAIIMDIQAELQSYIDEHDIHKLFALMVESLLIEKPSNPHQFVVDYMYKK